jgi:cysteine desulfurase/selenocysteine lyase
VTERAAIASDTFAAAFASPGPVTWLNTAHQGRLSLAASGALDTAREWKLHPEALATSERFSSVPERLRTAIGRLIGAPSEAVVLANSASYGLHLIVNGVDWQPGDEVVVAANDFPSNVLPWLVQRDRGVVVRQLEPATEVPTVDEVAAALNERTRVVCLSWVHSFSGRVLDLEGIGELCRSRGVWFVVNGAQAVGVRPIAVRRLPVDALISVGFKWLCGPYGTGFCYLHPGVRDHVNPRKLYWLTALSVEDLAAPTLDLTAVRSRGTHGFDVFGTANFFNFLPLAASIELLTGFGIDGIGRYVDQLVRQVLDGLDSERYRVVSSPEIRSSLVVFEPLNEPVDAVAKRLSARNIHVAQRRGRIRVSPHLYNSPADIERLLEQL